MWVRSADRARQGADWVSQGGDGGRGESGGEGEGKAGGRGGAVAGGAGAVGLTEVSK